MSTPADHPHPRRSSGELAEPLEVFTFGLMLFAVVAMVVTIFVLIAVL
jgi:hypothetical protein